jgi:hypothetical protein
MPMLLAACPSFERPWDEYVNDPTYDEELLYIHLAEFASHLVSLQKAGDTAEFDAVFSVTEDLHINGEPYVREAATIGLLEGIQNIGSNRDLDPESFVSYLKPESMKWWKKLNAFWSGDVSALRE